MAFPVAAEPAELLCPFMRQLLRMFLVVGKMMEMVNYRWFMIYVLAKLQRPAFCRQLLTLASDFLETGFRRRMHIRQGALEHAIQQRSPMVSAPRRALTFFMRFN